MNKVSKHELDIVLTKKDRMEKAYIILAHKNTEQLLRLVKRLDDNSSTFFIHIDKKSTRMNLSSLAFPHDKVHFLRRINTSWGSYGLVEATLDAMFAIKASNKRFDIITLLSGQDYPIKTNEHIDCTFKDPCNRIMIEYFNMPNFEKWSPGGGMFRLEKYFFGLKEYQLFSSRVVNLISSFIPFLKRIQPEKLKPFAGSQWWTIDMYALNYILNYVHENPRYSVFHKFTFAPDELYFHTILLNSTDERIRSSIVNDNKRFIRWRNASSSHPEILQEMDLHDIMHSEALFARKLDITEHPGLFELIDAHCLNKETAKA